jgi:dihydroorotate dehydrogenase electron transfer subunit
VTDPVHGPTDRPRIVTVDDNIEETGLVRTITFMDGDGWPDGVPGQFLMVWIPGIDEVPMSLTRIGRKKAFAVHNKGEATAALHALRPGDRMGVRGPYGVGFELGDSRKVLAVAGGTGIGPLAPLIEEDGKRFTVVIGAQTASELLYLDRVQRTGAEVVVTTDDGTQGSKGFATDAADELLRSKGFDMAVTCGPEVMMRKLAEKCQLLRMPCYCSTERYMKCGIGICDSCGMGGFQVCRDGPVFEGEVLLKIPEFGRWRRGASGKRESF